MSSGSGIAISNVLPANAADEADWTATITGTSNLSVTQSYQRSATSSVFTKGVSANGLNELQFDSSNYGFLESGGFFDYAVVLPGNWSTMGISTGDAQLIGVNSGFTVQQNFVYNAAANVTVLEVSNPNYTSGEVVGLDFILYGSAATVPEPASLVLLLGGLALVMLTVRRRRQAGVIARW